MKLVVGVKSRSHLALSEIAQNTIYLPPFLQFAMQKTLVPKELDLAASLKWKRRKSVNEKKWMQVQVLPMPPSVSCQVKHKASHRAKNLGHLLLAEKHL